MNRLSKLLSIGGFCFLPSFRWNCQTLSRNFMPGRVTGYSQKYPFLDIFRIGMKAPFQEAISHRLESRVMSAEIEFQARIVNIFGASFAIWKRIFSHGKLIVSRFISCSKCINTSRKLRDLGMILLDRSKPHPVDRPNWFTVDALSLYRWSPFCVRVIWTLHIVTYTFGRPILRTKQKK